MGKSKVVTKAIELLKKRKKDKKMKYSATKAEKENAIAVLKRSYGRNYEPTDSEIRETVKIERVINAEDPIRAAKDLIKERRKKDKLDSSQKKGVKEIAEEEQDRRDVQKFRNFNRGALVSATKYFKHKVNKDN